MKNTKHNSIKTFVILAMIILLNLGSFGFAHAASVNSLVDLANTARDQEGLTTLKINKQLTDAAQAKASDMFKNQYFAHISPDGKTPWDFIKSVDYNYEYAGENLSIGYTDNNELHTAWMNSPTHKANIMGANYNEIGLAVVQGKYQGSPTTIVVQMFGKSAPVVASVTINNNSITASTVESNVLGETIEVKSALTDAIVNRAVDPKLIVLIGLILLSGSGYLIYRLSKSQHLA